ncbi:MAG TPA: hypothetical protein G4O09_09640 [Dehalococcoidia bacterium]|nr:hypothetical protein [Dehalococcoidia bacterium]
MNETTTGHLIKTVVRWLLLATVVIFIITGFGITEFRVVESLTLGLLTKVLAFKVHTSPGPWLALAILLILHIGLSYGSRGKRNVSHQGTAR